ncbi:MAG: DUF58 domain-containing protein [Cyclobacteriaceae bacterium]|nr:DUF58 domain-containing protein [Cyclobacteriaceae bacterium]UYN85951.1 MAG: DUF58 domain-containing protein [Cyclobacteriaceae bacterium]
MHAQVKSLLKPEILNTVNGLELIARIIVEGFMSGSNKSQSVGAGQEFSQYRNYEPGDDLRQLDWKMYARSERYFIKQADIETNITVKFMLDASNSMAYMEDGVSKLQFAKVMIAALAYLARKQSDTFGLYTVNEHNISVVQPRFEQQQFMRFLNELVKVKSEGTWKKGNGLELLYDHHGKEMILFFTDLYDEQEDLFRFISRLKTPRNEVIVFHILGKHERDFDFEGSFTFEDLESNVRVKADTTIQRKEYTERVGGWIKQSRAWMLEKHINYQLVVMNDPIEQTLRDFLKIRKIINR